MGLSEVLGIVIIILLLTLILLQITGRKKTDLGEIRLLLKHASDEQRESVQKQIANVQRSSLNVLVLFKKHSGYSFFQPKRSQLPAW